MREYYKTDEWKIIEEGFNPEMHEASESMFSLGNGYMGQRANFEEKYSGETLQGTYIAGVYYPDKTRVGWWKNGYPEYFAKVLNAPTWIGINVKVDGEELDLHTCKVKDFVRELNMKEGFLLRTFKAELPSGKQIEVKAQRFLSIVREEIGAIRYEVTALNFEGRIELNSYLEGNVVNKDSNYDEHFWEVLNTDAALSRGQLTAITKKSDFVVGMTMKNLLEVEGGNAEAGANADKSDTRADNFFIIDAKKGCKVTLYKYVSVLNSLNYKQEEFNTKGIEKAKEAFEKAAENPQLVSAASNCLSIIKDVIDQKIKRL